MSPSLKSMSYQLRGSSDHITFLSNCSNPFRLAHGHEPNVSQPLGANFLLYPLANCQPISQISQRALQRKTTLVDLGAWFASSCFEVFIRRKKAVQFSWQSVQNRQNCTEPHPGRRHRAQRLSQDDQHVLYISNSIAFEPDG